MHQSPHNTCKHVLSHTLTLVNGFTPLPKKRRLAQTFTGDEITNMRMQRAQKDAAELKAREEESQRREEEVQRLKDMDESAKLNSVLDAIRDGGYPTLHSFMTALINTKDQIRSSQVSRLLINHGNELFEDICKRQPEVADDWALSIVRQKVKHEAKILAEYFIPEAKTPIGDILKRF